MSYFYIPNPVPKTTYIGNSLSSINISLTALDFNLGGLSAYSVDNITNLNTRTNTLSSNVHSLSSYTLNSCINISALGVPNGVATLSPDSAVQLSQLTLPSYEPTFLSFVTDISASNYIIDQAISSITNDAMNRFGTNINSGLMFPKFYVVFEGIDSLNVTATLNWTDIDVPPTITNHTSLASGTNAVAHFMWNEVMQSPMLLSFQKGYTTAFT